MIEKMYVHNLAGHQPYIDTLEFPSVLRACRTLMGLKQYACSDYLGLPYDRYKKLERGQLCKPAEPWEMQRLQDFYHLPPGLLQRKQQQFLSKSGPDRLEVCKSLWGHNELTRGESRTRRAAGAEASC